MSPGIGQIFSFPIFFGTVKVADASVGLSESAVQLFGSVSFGDAAVVFPADKTETEMIFPPS